MLWIWAGHTPFYALPCKGPPSNSLWSLYLELGSARLIMRWVGCLISNGFTFCLILEWSPSINWKFETVFFKFSLPKKRDCTLIKSPNCSGCFCNWYLFFSKFCKLGKQKCRKCVHIEQEWIWRAVSVSGFYDFSICWAQSYAWSAILAAFTDKFINHSWTLCVTTLTPQKWSCPPLM